jgi:ATP-dependent Clp protease ATP-binding subunit ClpC
LERFTERGRQVLVSALEEVREMGHRSIGSEHLLLGTLRDAPVAGILRRFDVTYDRVREHVERAEVSGEETPAGQVPLTENCTRVLQGAIEEADQIGRTEVEPEEILVALQTASDCRGARILLQLGADPQALRAALRDPAT